MAVRDLPTLLANRSYALYLLSRVALNVATQMLSVAVGWHVYEITGKALALGFSGLAQFLPAFLLALPGGHVADRRDRRRILLLCNLGVGLCATLLCVTAASGSRRLLPIYAVLTFLGAIRAFSSPAAQALMPNLLDRKDLERAIALSTSLWQLTMIAGPALGGAIYAATGRPSFVYGTCAILAVLAILAVSRIDVAKTPSEARELEPATWQTVLAGLRYVWSEKALLGSVSLDLFAVLLGGATALLPIFARDLLHVGPWGLGILRSAPAAGALVVALTMATHPLRRHAGMAMMACVFLFGIATIVFALSESFALSLAALLVLGAADMVSIVVRATLIQTRTPDAMRGRVGAVNMVFIGASNELGEFESGVTAAMLGPRIAVLIGGIGTCLVVALAAVVFPTLRDVDRMEDERAET